ncbi:hypothetical protein E8E13_000236 [Curvularia kusanoi]|uniref:F-box domain-containing protein n=1 Tax=Curvularia kusanoi TaxID=90978 RepID=A0A9P4T392_CURKU|nr:hypothetical protein E8E13_000236 [Curvularia kusanoi]
MSDTAKERRNSPSPEAMTAQPSQLASVDNADTASPLQITTNSNALVQRRDTSPQESATVVQQLARSDGAGMSFLELPAEIRNMIYSYVFPEGAALLLARHSGRGYIAMSDRLELLYTCRQIFEEATSMLKASRRFTIVQPKTLEYLMDQNCEMPCYCLERQGIFEQILARDALCYEYDMDRDTVRKNMPALLYVSTTLQDFILTFIRRIKVIAVASTATTRSSFTSFNALRDWLTRVPNCLFTHEFDDPFEISIILRFRSEVKYTPLKDIRFEINGLPDAMWSESCNGHLLYATSKVLVEQTRGVTSNTQLLVDVLAELVFFMQSAVRQHPELKGKRCPKI